MIELEVFPEKEWMGADRNRIQVRCKILNVLHLVDYYQVIVIWYRREWTGETREVDITSMRSPNPRRRSEPIYHYRDTALCATYALKTMSDKDFYSENIRGFSSEDLNGRVVRTLGCFGIMVVCDSIRDPHYGERVVHNILTGKRVKEYRWRSTPYTTYPASGYEHLPNGQTVASGKVWNGYDATTYGGPGEPDFVPMIPQEQWMPDELKKVYFAQDLGQPVEKCMSMSFEVVGLCPAPDGLTLCAFGTDRLAVFDLDE